jgi:hypothetical protein
LTLAPPRRPVNIAGGNLPPPAANCLHTDTIYRPRFATPIMNYANESPLQLRCRACQQPLPAQDVNIDLGIARCLACNAVFSLADSLGQSPRAKPIARLPKRFSLDHFGSDLTIQWRWFSHAVWFLVVFCVLWDGFLIAWYTAGIRELLFGSKGLPGVLMMLLFPMLHVAVGAGLTYLLLCMFVNKTVVRVTGSQLSIQHGPLPCTRNVLLDSSNIKQLYCTERHHRGKHGCSRTYAVVAVNNRGEKIKLVESLESLDQALFLEQQIEQHLKIRDERVAEESTSQCTPCCGQQTAVLA